MAGPKNVKAEAPKGWPLLWAACAIALVAGAAAGWFARDFMAVDMCLDAGGVWRSGGYCLGARE
jgi:hypothetical protein